MKNALETTQSSDKTIASLTEKVKQQDNYIAVLEAKLALANQQRFGKKSEKSNHEKDQLEIDLFDEASTPDNTDEIENADEEITVPAHKRKKVGRKPLPKDLPRVQHIHDIDDASKICVCGCALTAIGQDITEQLDIIPAKIQVIEHVKLKYACKSCELTVKTAAPKQPIERSIASPGTLAHVITGKYCDHLPLYRQEAVFKRLGVDIARNTLSSWIIKSSQLLRPLYQLLIDEINDYDIAYADETGAQVLKEDTRRAEQKGYMWCFIGGKIERRCIVYHYDPGRAHTVIDSVLPDFRGYLHSDGFGAYDTFARKRQVEIVGCMAHARRKFYEITKLVKSKGLAHDVVKMIAKLYAVEKACKQSKMTFEQIKFARERKSNPILKAIKALLIKNRDAVLPKGPLGKAMTYMLNQWDKLTRYLDDGRLEIDNNRTERAIKPFVIGRKNWLFSHSVAGVEASQIIFSLVETAKAHAIDPYAYFRYVLAKLPYASNLEDFDALLPFNVDPAALSHS